MRRHEPTLGHENQSVEARARVACAQMQYRAQLAVKVRILDNTIRLRLDRMEVGQIGAGSQVAGATNFPGGEAFRYTLEPTGTACSAKFCDGVIKIVISAGAAAAWASDETQVGIYETLALSTGSLELSIEKDFECLEPRRGENQSNRFKNPKNVI